jgi:predicted DNA-binding protein
VTTDKRRLLRASPPEGKSGRIIQVQLSAEQYERLYFMAFEAGRSLADQVRHMIEEDT